MNDILNIPIKYSKFPSNYINNIRGWGIDIKTLKNDAGKLLTLDIDFGAKCSLNCLYCFRKNNSVDSEKHTLTYTDLIKIVKDAKGLGLKSIKFLGAGEPLENEGILDFLHYLKELEIIPVIFSKTSMIGDDAEVEKYFKKYGIVTGIGLAKELFECGASIILGFNSFDINVESKMTGNGEELFFKRNKTLEILVKTGFSDTNPTRLALGINPITIANIDEALYIYKWARLRNIYAVVTPTMVSGRTKDMNWKKINPSREKLIDLYTEIYKFNLETSLMSLKQILDEGISSYAGGHPCNQVAAGLYITLNGVVLSCPGSEENVEGNIWKSSLKDIWLNSNNYKRQGTFNCYCVAKDGKSIPVDIYSSVLDKILTFLKTTK